MTRALVQTQALIDGRSPLAETSLLLECVGELQDAKIVAIAADDLDANW